MTADWLLRCGDGENFKNSSKLYIWGISSKHTLGKYFLKNVRSGDRLWFVKNKSEGKVIAVATFCSYNSREIGPLINLSLTDNELGWTGGGKGWNCDTEIHYKELYGLNNCELLTHIKGPPTIRKYDEKCRVNLPVEYDYIVKYSKVTLNL